MGNYYIAISLPQTVSILTLRGACAMAGYSHPDPPPTWPPLGGFEAADSANLIGWKRWITKENSLASMPPSQATFSHRDLLEHHLSSHMLRPDPCYAPAPNLQRGGSRHEWARFAGESTRDSSDPVLGYSSRWAKVKSRKPTPFAHLRSTSMSSLSFSAPRQLDVKPVDRSAIEARLRRPTPPAVTIPHVMSMQELAPEREEKIGRRKTAHSANDSTIQDIAFKYGS